MSSIKAKMEAMDSTRQEIAENEEKLHRMKISVKLQEEMEAISEEITSLKGKEFAMRALAEDPKEDEVKKCKLLSEAAQISVKIAELEKRKKDLEGQLSILEDTEKEKNFDKHRAFANIRELLKQSDVKIGSIEKEAGCQPGYMSRLEKTGNTSEPSVEFLVTAAKLLNVSLDMLVSHDLTVLSSTEKYLISFLGKLQKDTVDKKLEWRKETPRYLNNMEMDANGYVAHPLFDTIFSENHAEIVVISDTFGSDAAVHGDCYNLTLKNNSVLYLMDLCNNIHIENMEEFYVKEIWMYQPGRGITFLMSDKNLQYKNYISMIFEVVKEYTKHPQLKKDIRFVIDSFMADDWGVGEDDDVPFI